MPCSTYWKVSFLIFTHVTDGVLNKPSLRTEPCNISTETSSKEYGRMVNFTTKNYTNHFYQLHGFLLQKINARNSAKKQSKLATYIKFPAFPNQSLFKTDAKFSMPWFVLGFWKPSYLLITATFLSAHWVSKSVLKHCQSLQLHL